MYFESDNPARDQHSNGESLGAVAIAQALLLTINPRDVPAFETQTPMLEGNSSIKSGRVTIEKTRREFRDFPTAGSPSRGVAYFSC